MIKLKVKKLGPKVKLPVKGTEGSACYDVFSYESHTFVPNDSYRVKCGLAFEVPVGYEMEIRPRSSLASRGLILLNSPGTLDSDYRGELFALLMNLSSKNIAVQAGDRIVQFKINKVEEISIEEGEDLSKTSRGEGCLGSTGR